MNNVTWNTHLLGVLAIFLLPVGVAIAAVVLLLDSESIVRRKWRAHVANLRRQMDELFITTDPVALARGQAVAFVVLGVLGLFGRQPLAVLVMIAIVVGPNLWLVVERRKRTTQMEEQLAQWLMLLANALRATPSIGSAVEASVKLLPHPLREHVDLVVKEMRLGVQVEKALLSMGRRIDSQTLQSALATVVISQRTGGDVPRLLEESASGLREMARLEAHIRAKTAEGKMQAVILACIPVVLIFMTEKLKPGWFAPLFKSPVGYAVLAGCAGLWIAAAYIANRVLDVEV